MRALLLRLRANAFSLGMLALLVLAASLLLTATPHLANRHTDQGLRDRIGALSHRTRDVSYLARRLVDESPSSLRPSAAADRLADLRRDLPAPLRARLAGAWYSSQIGPDGVAASGADLDPNRPPPRLSLRDQSDAQANVRMVAGTWPDRQRVIDRPIPAAVSVAVAEAFGLHVGSRLRLRVSRLSVSTVDVDIVGVFEAIDPTAPVWAEQPEVHTPYTPEGEDPPEPWRAVMLTDARGVGAAAIRLSQVTYTWRFRVVHSSLDMAVLPELTKAVFDARVQTAVTGATTLTELDAQMSHYANEVAAVRAVLAVVQASILATLVGLVLLASAASVQRRRAELDLLRARGTSLLRLALMVLLESGLTVTVAVVAGFLVGRQVPGRPGPMDWLLLVFGAAAMLAMPMFAVMAHRRFSAAAPRTELSRRRLSARRMTAELTLVGVTVVGVFLVRRRGLAIGSDVDIYLALVPTLLGAAAALIALRAFPYPMRMVVTLAARARGAVPFLGLARAGRAATTSTGPLAVLVVAVSVGVFSASVAATVSAGRDRAADLAVPGDAFLQGRQFTRDTTARIAAVPGVTAVAATAVHHNTRLAAGEQPGTATGDYVSVIVVDGPALAAVLRASGLPQRLPPVLIEARPGPGPVPALVSPGVAALLRDVGGLTVEQERYGFRVAVVADTFPGLPIGTNGFVVLPLQALTRQPLPTGFAIAGTRYDPATLLSVADEGQRARLTDGPTAGPLVPATLRTHAAARAALDGAGVDPLLSTTFTAGAAGSGALALLAVGFVVVLGARTRRQALSRLRMLGLSSGQGRRLLAYELVPLSALGAVVGAVVGVALPVLVGPALGLSTFTGGVPAPSRLDPGLGLGAVVLVVVAMGLAVVLEAAIDRRARLGEVLRVGGES